MERRYGYMRQIVYTLWFFLFAMGLMTVSPCIHTQEQLSMPTGGLLIFKLGTFYRHSQAYGEERYGHERAHEFLRPAQQSVDDPSAVAQSVSKPCPEQLDLPSPRWWNYYKRGQSYAKKGCWLEAVEDFKTAIEQRQDDTYQARTYGLNFIDYFPHRELGIAYYKLGRYEDAIDQLQRSLEFVSVKESNKIANEFLLRAKSRQSTMILPSMNLNRSARDSYSKHLVKSA